MGWPESPYRWDGLKADAYESSPASTNQQAGNEESAGHAQTIRPQRQEEVQDGVGGQRDGFKGP